MHFKMGLFKNVVFIVISFACIHIETTAQPTKPGALKTYGKEFESVGDAQIDNIEDIYRNLAANGEYGDLAELVRIYGESAKLILNGTDETLDDTADTVGGIEQAVQTELYRFAQEENPRRGFVRAVKVILNDIAAGVEGVLNAFLKNIKHLADNVDQIFIHQKFGPANHQHATPHHKRGRQHTD